MKNLILKVTLLLSCSVSDNCDGTQKDWENILSQIRPEVDKAISDFCKDILY